MYYQYTKHKSLEPQRHIHLNIHRTARRPKPLPKPILKARPHLQLLRRVHHTNDIRADIRLGTHFEFMTSFISQYGRYVQSVGWGDFAILRVPLETVLKEKVSDHGAAIQSGHGDDEVFADCGVVAVVGAEEGEGHGVAGDVGGFC